MKLFHTSCILILFCSNFALAAEPAPVYRQLSQHELTAAQLIEESWLVVKDAISDGDLLLANEKINELENLMHKGGFFALEDYSLYLLAQATLKMEGGDIETAAFYTRKALQLSPSAPRVLLKSLKLVEVTGEGSVTQNLFKALRNLPRDYALSLSFAGSLIDGALMALSIALFLAFVVQFATQMVLMLRRLTRRVPPLVRGFLSPMILLALLISPLHFGLLWSLLSWSVILFFLLPEKRWLSFTASVALILWGMLIPLRQNIGIWLEDPGVTKMLSATTGDYAHWDSAALKGLLSRRPADGLVAYTYGQLLRREDNLDSAEAAFKRTEALLPNQPYTRAQLGMIAFLRNDYKTADRLFAEAQAGGLKSAELLFNYSKVKFLLKDTAGGKDLFLQASKTDEEAMKPLREREEELGVRSALGLAEINLPLWYVWRSALIANAGAHERSDVVSQSLMPGLTPPLMCGAGVFLLLLFLCTGSLRGRKRTDHFYRSFTPSQALLTMLRVIPGAALIIAGHPLAGLALLGLIIFLTLPFLGYSTGMAGLTDYIPGFESYYLAFLVLLVLAALYVCQGFREERFDA